MGRSAHVRSLRLRDGPHLVRRNRIEIASENRSHIFRAEQKHQLRRFLMHLRLPLKVLWKPAAAGQHKRFLRLRLVPGAYRTNRRVPTKLELWCDLNFTHVLASQFRRAVAFGFLRGVAGARKTFFSEEKNQKTLRRCRGPCKRHIHLNLQKSFASFLQKRRPSFHPYKVYLPPRPV